MKSNAELIRKFEPVMLFSRDEEGEKGKDEYFFPMAARDFVHGSGLWDRDKPGWRCLPGHTRLNTLASLQNSKRYYLTYSIGPQDSLTGHWSANRYPNWMELSGMQLSSNQVQTPVAEPQLHLRFLPISKEVKGYYRRAKEKYKKVKDRNRPVYHYRVHWRNWQGSRFCVLQYWFLYAWSDWKLHGGLNLHEGDWEMIVVFLRRSARNSLDPYAVAYSHHHNLPSGPYVVRWDNYKKVNHHGLRQCTGPARLGDHPLVFVGCGSHASYPKSGLHQLRLDYALGNGQIIVPDGYAAEDHMTWVKPIRIDDKHWNTKFGGLWGALFGTDGPVGPAHQRRKWKTPAEWAGL
jgi:hypothetical protein